MFSLKLLSLKSPAAYQPKSTQKNGDEKNVVNGLFK